MEKIPPNKTDESLLLLLLLLLLLKKKIHCYIYKIKGKI
jgi:hypothetical protein